MKKFFKTSVLVLVGFGGFAYANPPSPPAGIPILNSRVHQRNSVMNIDTATIRSVDMSTFTNAPDFSQGFYINGALYNSNGVTTDPLDFSVNLPTGTISYLNVSTLTIRGDISYGNSNVNVKQYGAKGDGVTDDSAALTAAYAVVKTSSGTLFFPPGNYLTTTSLKPVGNTRIIGSGPGQSKITYTGTGFWLDNTDSGTAQSNFEVSGFSGLMENAHGFARIGDPTVTAFSETNQHIFFTFDHLVVDGNSSSITANSHFLQLTTMYKCRITNCNVRYFSVILNLKKFDEGHVEHNTTSGLDTYNVYAHNDMTGGSAQVADETTFINNSFGIPNSNTVSIYLYQIENIRFKDTYIESTANSVNTAVKMNTVYNCTFDGMTIGSVDTFFDITNGRNINLIHVGMQDPEQSGQIIPAISTVSFSQGGTQDLNGNGGVFVHPLYGQITVKDCAYPIANSFKNYPWVNIESSGKYGPGASKFGGMLGDVSGLYSTQILNRNGTNGLLKEPSLVLASPLASNTYWNGITTSKISADTNTATGFAMEISSAVSGTVAFDIPYTDIVPGAYEITARIRNRKAITSALMNVYYDNPATLKESFSGINTATTYKIITARFNFQPTVSTTTLTIRLDSSEELYIDYLVLRPYFNSITIQKYVPSDVTAVGSSFDPGYTIYFTTPSAIPRCWKGDIAYSTAPAVGDGFAATCVTSGAPGTWKWWGALQ